MSPASPRTRRRDPTTARPNSSGAPPRADYYQARRPRAGILAVMSHAPVVLLDVGGVLMLPEPALIRQVLAPLGVEVDAAVVDAAHYRAAAAAGAGEPFGDAYVRALGVPPDRETDAMDALEDLFTDPDVVWTRTAPGAPDCLPALTAAEARVGVLSDI